MLNVNTGAWDMYLVEHYRPGISVEGLRHAAALVQTCFDEMRREGKSVRYVRSTIVPRDEAYLSLVEAASEALVREAYARAGVPYERISAAISADANEML